MCYLLTFIFNQTEGQSHQSLNTLTAPRPSPFRRWVSIHGGGPDLVRAMKPRGFHLVFFLRKVYAKSILMYEIPRFLNDMDIFCWREKNPLTCWIVFLAQKKSRKKREKLTSSVPYHEDRCLPPKLNPPPLINKAFPLTSLDLHICPTSSLGISKWTNGVHPRGDQVTPGGARH